MSSNHAMYLGQLLGNFHSLEICLRAFIDNTASNDSSKPAERMDYYNLKPGDEVQENPFTNYDSLGTLVTKYNSLVATLGSGTLVIDKAVIDLRNLIAHGRVSADSPDLDRLVIIKFDQPKLGRVKVTDIALMSNEWFSDRIQFVREQLEKVNLAAQWPAT